MQQKLHENADYGMASVHYASIVADVAKAVRATELLDYGAGKGRLGQELRSRLDLQLLIYHYDPAIPQWSAPPAPRRFVACIDVLEHIEPDLLQNVLDDLKRVVLGWAFSPCTRARRSRSCRTDATRISFSARLRGGCQT